MEASTDRKVLKTNLNPFFWGKVKKVIQRNKKAALEEFLFGSQVERLQEKVIHLDREGNLNMLSEAKKTPVKPPLDPQLGNTSLNQINGLNLNNYDYYASNFITLGNISEQEKIEIIQTGLKVYF